MPKTGKPPQGVPKGAFIEGKVALFILFSTAKGIANYGPTGQKNQICAQGEKRGALFPLCADQKKITGLWPG